MIVFEENVVNEAQFGEFMLEGETSWANINQELIIAEASTIINEGKGGDIWAKIKEWAAKVAAWFRKVWGKITAFFRTVLDKLLNLFTNDKAHVKRLQSKASFAKDVKMKGVYANVKDGSVHEIIGKIVDDVEEAADSLGDIDDMMTAETVNQIKAKAEEVLKKYNGTESLQKTMLGAADTSETTIPAGDFGKLMSGVQGVMTLKNQIKLIQAILKNVGTAIVKSMKAVDKYIKAESADNVTTSKQGLELVKMIATKVSGFLKAILSGISTGRGQYFAILDRMVGGGAAEDDNKEEGYSPFLTFSGANNLSENADDFDTELNFNF